MFYLFLVCREGGHCTRFTTTWKYAPCQQPNCRARLGSRSALLLDIILIAVVDSDSSSDMNVLLPRRHSIVDFHGGFPWERGSHVLLLAPDSCSVCLYAARLPPVTWRSLEIMLFPINRLQCYNNSYCHTDINPPMCVSRVWLCS